MSSLTPDTTRPEAALRARGFSFRAQLILGVCGLVLLTGLAITWLAHLSARESTDALSDALFREASAHAVSETRAFTDRAVPVVESLRRLAGEGLVLDDADALGRQLLAFLQSNPGLSWVSCSDETGTFTGAYRTADGQQHIKQNRIEDGRTPTLDYDVEPDGTWRLARPEFDSRYDPRVRAWYMKIKATGQLTWMPPYIFYDQGVPGITCGAPLLNQQGEFRGVVTADFDLNALTKFVARLSVSPNSRFFMYTSHETLLAHPTEKVIGATGQRAAGELLTLADVDDPLVVAFRGRVARDPLPTDASELFQRFQFDRDGTEYLGSTTAFRIGGDQVWVIGAVAPKADFLSEVWRSQTIALMAATGALLIAVLLAGLMAQSVSTPVLKMIGFMNRVGGGDLDAKAAFGGSRDFHNLADALNRMIADLRDRLRLRYSLNVAMEVQQRLLPAQPPRVPGLEVAGHSTYCDETGGDYYDFLTLDEAAPGSLLLVMGDVMGHGVAAALVMAGVRAVLRDRAESVTNLAELMSRLNKMMSNDLDGSRFMTMYLSVIDSHSGSMRWVTAGHDPAIFYDPTEDRFDEAEESSVPLGIMDDAEYVEREYRPLKAGQVIVIGTDGVWEMQNAAGEQFGKPRLRDLIRDASRRSAEEILQTIAAGLADFRGDQKALDDVTFVVVKVVKLDDAGLLQPTIATAIADI